MHLFGLRALERLWWAFSEGVGRATTYKGYALKRCVEAPFHATLTRRRPFLGKEGAAYAVSLVDERAKLLALEASQLCVCGVNRDARVPAPLLPN